MKKILLMVMLASLLLCTGCSKELVCNKGGENASTKIVVNFDENDKPTSIVVTEKTDVTKLGIKKEEITTDYLNDYHKKYSNNKNYDNVTVTSKDTFVIVSYDVVLDSNEAPHSYNDAKDMYNHEGFTCE